jgi:hypothetical protein
MTKNDILQLCADDYMPVGEPCQALMETHISWVLLSENFAFKIKKPVSYTFVNFSSLEKRQYSCQRELLLNRRLAPDVYLDVVSIFQSKGRFTFRSGDPSAEVADFAVCMRRLDNARRMDVLLLAGAVTIPDMARLGSSLVSFHLQAERLPTLRSQKAMQADFNDLLTVSDFVGASLGEQEAKVLTRVVAFSDRFLARHYLRLEQRHVAGFYLDGHGDLHSRNIFLLDSSPVIFDCIEFNDDFRHLDVLSELAFLCMDLDHFGSSHLASTFISAYQQLYPCFLTEEDEMLFQYFKIYRANVRLKVYALKARSGQKDIAEVSEYIGLLAGYLDHFPEKVKRKLPRN